MNPALAKVLAKTALRAALPACSGLVIVPRLAKTPPVNETVMPKAVQMVGGSRSNIFAAAAVAPMAPVMPTECQPRPCGPEPSQPPESRHLVS